MSNDLFGLEDGSSATDTGKEFEIEGGGSFEPIPEGTSVLAMIDEAKWSDPGFNHGNPEERIELRWSIIAPEEYKNRKIFHKLWVTDFDPNAKDETKAARKRDKARRMLAAIDANAGGKLAKLKTGIPDSDALMTHLSNKPMVIKLMVWEMADRENPGEMIRGNWVAAVSPKSKKLEEPAPKPKKEAAKKPEKSPAEELDDEIPF